MPLITRRHFIDKTAIATTATRLSLSASRSANTTPATVKEESADAIEFSPEDLEKMFNNRRFPPRPDQPCPLPKSSAIKDIRFTYRYRTYRSVTLADTWVTSWAADGNLYSAYADGSVQRVGVICHADGVDDWYYPAPHVGFYAVPDKVFQWGSAKSPPKFINIKLIETNRTTTSNAIIAGDDPFDLTIRAFPATELTLSRFGCCYPAGCLVKDNIWFYACQYRSHFVDRTGNQQCFAQDQIVSGSRMISARRGNGLPLMITIQ